MQVGNSQLRDFIEDSNLVERGNLESAFAEAEKNKKFLGDLLLEKKLMREDDLRKLYAYILGVPFIDLSKETVPKEILNIVPKPIAEKYKIVAFAKDGHEVKIATLNPNNIQMIDFIRKKTGMKIVVCITSEADIEHILKQYERSLKAEFGDIIDKNLLNYAASSDDSEKEEEDLEKVAQGLPIIRIVDTLIKHAMLQSASDIHIEPDEKEVRVRYRIDGILRDAMILPKEVLAGVVARIKVLSNLKLDEHRLPQDGRFKLEDAEHKMSFRVSVLPIFDGEKVVMRLLDESNKGLTLEKIGLSGEGLEIVHREIKKPNGMMLVTGPTGSGKTSTLYTVMDILNTPGVNISTVEDPIEYRMKRINQTQVHPKIGLTFASGLRSLLRQDPDIIMVGEIRDKETMEMALHSAMTGHLVLSTLHTNSAAGALPRLLDMGAEPFLVASTVNVIIAQRLVRKLCPECRQTYKLSEKELKVLSSIFNMELVLKTLRGDKEIKKAVGAAKDWKDFTFYKAKGCDQCAGEGYKGRIGIFEVLEVDETMEKLIVKRASDEEVEKVAREQGMHTMVEDGFIKAIGGITSIEEITRVSKE